MSQRASGYARRADEEYPTPGWVAEVIGDYLHKLGGHNPRGFRVRAIWEPAAGHPALADALMSKPYDGKYGDRPRFQVTATSDDFFKRSRAPDHVDAIVTNPPYGDDRRGQLASDFIRHALTLDVRIVAMLLRVDFDSAKTRVDLFRDNRRFAAKLTLLNRVKWFEGPSAPSDNHAWFVWDAKHRGPPRLAYCERREGS